MGCVAGDPPHQDPGHRLPGGHDLVELVTPDGSPCGTLEVDQAHLPPGRLHRAFSIMLLDGRGRMLLHQRASCKTRFPLLWTNTCCGHPRPGHDLLTCAAVRLDEEMGVRDVVLREVGTFLYTADDVRTGLAEHELDHVIIGMVGTGLVPDPDPREVGDWAWVVTEDLLGEISKEAESGGPSRFTPWLPHVLGILRGVGPTGSHRAV
jgi:isopentenyl-diphosphate Delta-isomerase